MKRFCNWPFEKVWIRNDGKVSICCRMKKGGILEGSLLTMNFEDIINSVEAQDMRKNILNGTYAYCSHDCPKLFDKQNASKNNNYQRILEKNDFTVSEVKEIVLGYDKSCSLTCPSCRKTKIWPRGDELTHLMKYHEMILTKIPAPEVMNVSGSGDAIGSVTTRSFLRNFSKYPKFSATKLTLATNGVLLTPKIWDSIADSHNNIATISISVDGATEETYKKIRTGSFKHLKRNMLYLKDSNRRQSFRWYINFIVQKGNYREMGEMVDLCQEWRVDRLHFIPIRFWGSGAYTKEEMVEQQIFNSTHHLFEDFLKCLNDSRLNAAIVDLQGCIRTLKNSYITSMH